MFYQIDEEHDCDLVCRCCNSENFDFYARVVHNQTKPLMVEHFAYSDQGILWCNVCGTMDTVEGFMTNTTRLTTKKSKKLFFNTRTSDQVNEIIHAESTSRDENRKYFEEYREIYDN